MSDESKFIAEEELLQIKSFKAQKDNIIFALGKNRIEKETLLASFKNVANQEQEYYNKLSIKYGDGSLDLNTGEIIPFNTDEQNI
jgi:ATPase subunit of ABC transporter with duplicated ATPase domains